MYFSAGISTGLGLLFFLLILGRNPRFSLGWSHHPAPERSVAFFTTFSPTRFRLVYSTSLWLDHRPLTWMGTLPFLTLEGFERSHLSWGRPNPSTGTFEGIGAFPIQSSLPVVSLPRVLTFKANLLVGLLLFFPFPWFTSRVRVFSFRWNS